MKIKNAAFLFILSLSTFCAQATIITFDEAPAASGVAYAGTAAAAFSLTNFGTVGGNSKGNPGNWGLEGTNGSQFLGFNSSYSETVTFASSATNVSADFSRSNGSSSETIQFNAYDGNILVDSVSVALGAINNWTTLSVSSADITSVTWTGTGSSFHPYGVDNFNFVTSAAVPEPTSVALLGLGILGFVASRRKSAISKNT